MRSRRWCLQGSIRTLNMALNVIAIAMIVYSLWLFREWEDGVSRLSASTRSALPKPWFIFTCLGVGMVVCLITVCGYIAMNLTKYSILCIYIATIFSLVLLQAGVTVAIFFNMDLDSVIKKLIEDDHAKFKDFISFHIHVCCWITIAVVVGQVNLIILAMALLCVVGTEPMNNSGAHLVASLPDFRYSFLIPPNPNVNDTNTNCNISQDVVDASRTTKPILLQILCC